MTCGNLFYLLGKVFPVTDIDSPLSLYLSMFSSSKNTSSFLEIVRSLFTMLILVEWGMDCGKIVVHICIVPLLPPKWYFFPWLW